QSMNARRSAVRCSPARCQFQRTRYRPTQSAGGRRAVPGLYADCPLGRTVLQSAGARPLTKSAVFEQPKNRAGSSITSVAEQSLRSFRLWAPKIKRNSRVVRTAVKESRSWAVERRQAAQMI